MPSDRKPRASHADFFAELGLSALTLDQKNQLLAKVELSAREQVITLILNELDEADCRLLSKTIEKGATEQQILEFLHERIPELEALVTARITRFKDELISQVQSIQTDMRQIRDSSIPAVIPVDKKKARTEMKQLEKESNRLLMEGKFDQLHPLQERIRELKTLLLS